MTVTSQVTASYLFEDVGLSLSDLLGEGNDERLAEELGRTGSDILVQEIRQRVSDGVRGKPRPSQKKRERVKKVMDAVIEDIRRAPDVFYFRNKVMKAVTHAHVAFLIELYSEPE